MARTSKRSFQSVYDRPTPRFLVPMHSRVVIYRQTLPKLAFPVFARVEVSTERNLPLSEVEPFLRREADKKVAMAGNQRFAFERIEGSSRNESSFLDTLGM